MALEVLVAVGPMALGRTPGPGVTEGLAVLARVPTVAAHGLLSNRPLLGAVLLTFVLQLAVVYVPFLQGIFKTVALPPSDLTISLLLSTVVFWGVELEKWRLRRRDA